MYLAACTAALLFKSIMILGSIALIAPLFAFWICREWMRNYNEKLQLYQNVIDQSPLSIIITDMNSRIEYINPYFTQITGYSLEEVRGRTPSILRTDKTEGQTYRELWDTLNRGENWEGEFVNKTKDGEEYTEAVIISSIKNQAGTITHYVGIKENVSEYKRIKKELSDQLYFTSQLVDTLPHPLFYMDSEGSFLGCNYAYEKAFQVQRRNLIGMHISDLPHLTQDGYQIIREMKEEVMSRGATDVRQIQRLFATGENHDILYSLSAYRLSDRTIGGYLGIMTDISDLKSKEKELVDSMQFLDIVISHIPVMLYVKDAKTLKYYKVNKACADFLGKTPDEMLDLTVYDLFPPDTAKRLNAMDRKVLETRQIISEIDVFPGYSEECALRYVQASVLPILDSNGEPLYLLGVSEDITGAKLKEEELKYALSLAEEATIAKSQFLANMSHEIRTPMNAIIGLAYLALRTGLNLKQRDYVSKIHNAGTSLLVLVNEILDFSKIESGSMELEDTGFELQDIIQNAVDLSSQAAHDKGLELLCYIPQDIPRQLEGDPLRLVQIITNLLSNAVKFTENGEVAVTVEMISCIDTRVKLKFSVRDTGIGLSKEAENKIFLAFTQADSSTTRKFGGTGLGLAISRRLVEMMGGDIWVQSEEGKGSKFSFTAWFGIGQADASKPLEMPEGERRLKILVVDDNRAAREILTEYLQNFKCLTTAAASSDEALNALRENDAGTPYDAVFLDWQLAGIDGMETVKLIKNGAGLLHIPAIVLVKPFGIEDIRQHPDVNLVDDFVVKPINQSLLYDTLITLFHGPKPSTEKAVIHEKNYGLSGIRVLVAEDNEINRQIAVELLKSQGIIADVAPNGAEAVRMVEQMSAGKPYQIVIVDLQMPVMDGFEAAKRIRELDKELPIIAMTARTMQEERELTILAGMNDHVAKPVDPDILFTKIGKWASGTSGEIISLQKVPAYHQISTPLKEITIRGIDLTGGLKRVGGNETLYMDLLLKYAENQRETVSKLLDSVSRNDFAAAHRLAHNLKGVSGNIGALEVQNLSGDIVKLLIKQQNTEWLSQLLRRLQVVVSQISNDISSKLDELDLYSDKDNILEQHEALNEIVDNLLIVLKDNDYEAVDYFNSVKGTLALEILPEQMATLESHIRMFEYDEAITVLETALSESNNVQRLM